MNTPIKLLVALSAVAILPACEPPDLKWGGWQDLGGPSKSSYLRVLRGRAANDIPTWGSARNDAWAIRSGALLHWDGVSWTAFNTPSVRAVWGLSSKQVWAVGENETLLEWNGSTWRTLSTRENCFSSRDCATFRGVWGTGPGELWVVGENGPGFGGSAYGAIQKWDGKGWTIPRERPEEFPFRQLLMPDRVLLRCEHCWV